MAKPRVLLFPFPAPGHIKPFLSLAELLSDAGLDVVFLSTEYNLRRIPNIEALASRFPSLHFETISDGLPPDQPRNLMDATLYFSMRDGTKSRFRQLIQSLNGASSADPRPITCIVNDAILSSPIEVAEELGIPAITFCPYSARYLSIHFLIPKLVEEGQIPFTDGNVVGEIEGVPFLRRDHLPGFWSVKSLTDELWSHDFVNETLAVGRTWGVILNTFDDLEPPFLTHLSSIFNNKIYTIGPLNALSKSRLGESSSAPSALAGFWKEDQPCISWLDSQPPRSVLFVSFGSTMKMEATELTELWHGLANSGKRFLCVLRPDVVDGGDGAELIQRLVEEEREKKKKNGINFVVVEWAAQEKVLAHPAVGGFLTHCGWNSTVESVVAGVPMICWPVLGDQLSNATWVDKVWNVGIERNLKWDRSTVEMMVTELMEGPKGVELRTSMDNLSKLANQKVVEGGSSFHNLELLIDDIKKLKPSS